MKIAKKVIKEMTTIEEKKIRELVSKWLELNENSYFKGNYE